MPRFTLGPCTHLLVLAAAAVSLAGQPLFAAPDWVPDAPNSRWLELGEKADSQGVSQMPCTSEGTPQPATRAGRPCWEVVPTPREKGGGGGRYWYFLAGDWNDWTRWIGEKDVQVTFLYFDGKPANVAFAYDSSDPSVTAVPQHPGAWRQPEDLKSGLVLKGSGTWKTLTVPLPMALFQKRCNGGDFRFGPVPAESDFALAGVALTRVPRRAGGGAPPPARLELPLAFVRGEGVLIEGRRVRFAAKFVQEPGKPIVLEPENAAVLQTDGRGDIGRDAAAGGGAFVHFVVSSEIAFTVKTPGKYQAWERGRFPGPGHWCHSEMIGTQSANVDDCNGPVNQWIWIRAGVYDLPAGEHRMRVQYMAGAQLDQIVLLPVGVPAPTAPLPPSPRVAPARGWAESGDLRPLDVERWLDYAAKLPLAGPADAVSVEVSTDAGKTYRPLPAHRSLAGVGAAGGGKDRVRFRVVLKATDGAPLPFLQNVTVGYAPGPNNEVSLSNEAAALTFGASGLVRLEHRATGHGCTRDGAQAPLFALGLKRPGPAPLAEITSAAGSLEGYDLKDLPVGKRLSLTYRMANGMTVVARVLLAPSGVTRWTLEIANPTDLEVAEVEFPILPGVRLGDDPTDDTLFFPRCWGQVWRDPVSKNVGAYWGPHMRWMDLWDRTDGLYVGVHDDQLHDTCLAAPADSATSLKMSVRQRVLVKPGGTWSSGERVVAFHDGDWHSGADLYRAYVAKALQRPDPAEWVRWIDLWGTQASNDLPQKGWGVLPEDGDRMAAEGLDLLAANRQMMDGMDSGYCGLYLYPALGWGSTREFAQQLAALRRRGVHYTPYMNWHLWSPGYGHHPRCGITPWKAMPADAPRRDDAWWAKVAARGYDGSFPAVVTDRYDQMDADIGAPEWRERLAYWTRRYNAWGADGMYYDQFNITYFSGRLPTDYSTYGFWTRATLDTLRRIKEEARKSNPYYVSSGEAYMDTLGQAVDLHMTSGVVNRLEFYAYCNPWQMIIDGGWNGGLAPAFGGHERERFVWQVGARFEQLAGPEPWRSRVLALRRQVKSLLYRAAFRDTVGLTIHSAAGQGVGPEPAAAQAGGPEHAPYSGISGRWFLFREGGQSAAVINLINTPLDEGATLAFRTGEIGPVRAAWAFTLEGALLRVEGRQEGDTYRLRLPKTELATVVLVNRLAPVVQWSLDAAAAAGETAAFRLSLTNLEPAPVAATVGLRPPKGWPAASVKSAPIAPGATVAVSLPARVPAGTKPGRCDVRADVATPAGAFTAYRMLTVVEPVTAEFRGDPGGYHLLVRNHTGKPVRGTVAVGAPAPLKVSAPAGFDLPAHGDAKVPVTVEGQDRLDRLSEMSAMVSAPGAKWNLVRVVVPVVANGDFEQDGAGDRRPDWWMCRKKADVWDPESMRLEEGGPSGKYCLRVDASDDATGFVRAYTVHGAVKPDTRYRIRGWVKRAEAGGDVAVRFSGFGWAGLRTEEVGKWVRLEAEVKSGANPTGMVVNCLNASRGPAWFDGISVEEVR